MATYHLFGIYNGNISHQQKIIVGSAQTPTPLLACSMSGITFHPSWGVPASIFLRSLKKKIQNNPHYLTKHHYTVFDKRGKPVDPFYIAWESVTRHHFPYVIRQKPGPFNSLGRIKFHLNTADNIHLHDTPRKELFYRRSRALSAGCIRLEKAAKLAEWLGIPYHDDMPAQHITFQKSLPVVLTYITLWFDGDTLFVSNDPYQLDV